MGRKKLNMILVELYLLLSLSDFSIVISQRKADFEEKNRQLVNVS